MQNQKDLYLVEEGNASFISSLEQLQKENIPEVNWDDEALVVASDEQEAEFICRLYDSGAIQYDNVNGKQDIGLVALQLNQSTKLKKGWIVRERKHKPAQIRHINDYASGITKFYNGQYDLNPYWDDYDEINLFEKQEDAIELLQSLVDNFFNERDNCFYEENTTTFTPNGDVWEGFGWYDVNGRVLYLDDSSSATDGDCLTFDVIEVEVKLHSVMENHFELVQV